MGTADPAAIRNALAGLFPRGVAVAAVGIGDDHPPPYPAESASLSGAVPSRRAEFAAGRAAARMALAAFGHAAVAIPAGRDRAPVWPQGIAGSISHGAGYAVAAVHAGGPLGVDVEAADAVDADLWSVICATDELDALPRADRAQAVARIFSAKESVFKAQYALTGAVIGFDAVSVRLDGDRFTARFRQPVGPFAAGHEMPGRSAHLGGVIVTGVMA